MPRWAALARKSRRVQDSMTSGGNQLLRGRPCIVPPGAPRGRRPRSRQASRLRRLAGRARNATIAPARVGTDARNPGQVWRARGEERGERARRARHPARGLVPDTRNAERDQEPREVGRTSRVDRPRQLGRRGRAQTSELRQRISPQPEEIAELANEPGPYQAVDRLRAETGDVERPREVVDDRP
jgi:hypothetical protein